MNDMTCKRAEVSEGWRGNLFYHSDTCGVVEILEVIELFTWGENFG